MQLEFQQTLNEFKQESHKVNEENSKLKVELLKTKDMIQELQLKQEQLWIQVEATESDNSKIKAQYDAMMLNKNSELEAAQKQFKTKVQQFSDENKKLSDKIQKFAERIEYHEKQRHK